MAWGSSAGGRAALAVAVALLAACGSDLGTGRDGGRADAGPADGGGGGPRDGGPVDGDVARDAAPGPDAGPPGSPCGLGAWIASEPFADDTHVSHPLPSFARGGWFYVHTMTPDGDDRVLYAAAPRADGTLGPWQVASTDHGGGPHGFTAVVAGGEAYHFRNGHIARYPLDDAGHMTGDVVLLEDDPTTAFDGERYVWDTAVYVPLGAGRVAHLGGFSFTPYDYRQELMADTLPLGPRFERLGISHPATRPGRATFVQTSADGGFIFTGESGASRLWRAPVSATGDVASFEALGGLPAGDDNGRGDLFAVEQLLVAIRGSQVHVTTVAADGSLGGWRSMPPLPEPQVDVHWGDGHLAGASWGVIGDHVYVAGQRRAYAAPLSWACD